MDSAQLAVLLLEVEIAARELLDVAGPITLSPGALHDLAYSMLRLVEDLLKGHRPPSLRRGGVQQTVWEWGKSVGPFIPQMGDKRKPQGP